MVHEGPREVREARGDDVMGGGEFPRRRGRGEHFRCPQARVEIGGGRLLPSQPTGNLVHPARFPPTQGGCEQQQRGQAAEVVREEGGAIPDQGKLAELPGQLVLECHRGRSGLFPRRRIVRDLRVRKLDDDRTDTLTCLIARSNGPESVEARTGEGSIVAVKSFQLGSELSQCSRDQGGRDAVLGPGCPQEKEIHARMGLGHGCLGQGTMGGPFKQGGLAPHEELQRAEQQGHAGHKGHQPPGGRDGLVPAGLQKISRGCFAMREAKAWMAGRYAGQGTALQPALADSTNELGAKSASVRASSGGAPRAKQFFRSETSATWQQSSAL